MAHGRPLWSMTVVRDLQLEWSDAEAAVIVRVHPALLDGLSITEWLRPAIEWRESSLEIHGDVGMSNDLHQSDRDSSRWPQSSSAKSDVLRMLQQLMGVAYESAFDWSREWMKGGTYKKLFGGYTVPVTLLDSRSCTKAVSRLMTLNCQRVQDVLTHFPTCTDETVILGVLGGAMRYWLQHEQDHAAHELVGWMTGALNNRSDNSMTTCEGLVHLKTDIEDPIKRINGMQEELSRGRTEQLLSLFKSLPMPVAVGIAKGLKLSINRQQFTQPLVNVCVQFEPEALPTQMCADHYVWSHQWSMPTVWPNHQLSVSVQKSGDFLALSLMAKGLTAEQLLILEQGIHFSLQQLEAVLARTPKKVMGQSLLSARSLHGLTCALDRVEALVDQAHVE